MRAHGSQAHSRPSLLVSAYATFEKGLTLHQKFSCLVCEHRSADTLPRTPSSGGSEERGLLGRTPEETPKSRMPPRFLVLKIPWADPD